jgi:hypothetical protein
MPEPTPVHTGGCQCGAVRYALYGEPTHGSICHCRMCQKASGNYFAAFARVRLQDFAWTRGEPAVFKSSELVERGFCRDCGTPLFFRYLDLPRISVAVGSLDDPAPITMDVQYGVQSRLPAFDTLHALPSQTSNEGVPQQRLQKLASRQHPDHD